MSYVSAVSEAIDELEDGRRHDVSVVLAGLDLVLCGWQIHTGVGGSGRRAWAVFGTAAQAVVEEFDDLPPVYYTVHPVEDGAEAWRQTVRLLEAIAGRLDRMAANLLTRPIASVAVGDSRRPAACGLGGSGITYGRWLDESRRALVGAQSALLRASVGDYSHAAEVVGKRDRCRRP
jgi:hypothetical protein